ncbi:MAG: putative Ig domain-containing protein [bacterium JZ-2024 1]
MKKVSFRACWWCMFVVMGIWASCGRSGGLPPAPPPGLSPNIEPPTAPPATVGVPYNLSFRWTVNTARPPFFWHLIGSMPPGLQFDPPNGRIYGIPTTPGSFSFTVVVRDSNSPQREESRSYTLLVGSPLGGPLTITTRILPRCKVGVPYMVEILVTGGLSPYTWSMDGNLVPGLTLDQKSGKIEGTPTTTGSYTFTARVFDSQIPSNVATQTLTITCIDPLQITTETLPDAEVGVFYFQQLQAKGGMPCAGGPNDYVWSLESGFFPPGLTLNANGSITGTATAPGNYDFLVRVTDCDAPPETTTKNFTITVNLVGADRFLCVDGINGDDATGDGSSANPFKTINRALQVVSANNMNPSLPRIGAIRIAGSPSGPPLQYNESVTLNAGNGTDVSLLGGWVAFPGDSCSSRLLPPPTDPLNVVIKGLGGPAITTLGLTRSVLIEQLSINGNDAIDSRSTAIENNNSSPTIARNKISGGNASGANSISEGIWNHDGSAPLIVDNEIYGGVGGSTTRAIFNEGAGTNPEIRDNTKDIDGGGNPGIDGGDPSGGGTTTSVGIKNQSGANPIIYDNVITGGTGTNAYGIWNDPASADIARNTIDCEGSATTRICQGILVYGNSSATITANFINMNSATSGNRGLFTRGITVAENSTASIRGNTINGGEGSNDAYGVLVSGSALFGGSSATIGGPAPGESNTIYGGGCSFSNSADTRGIRLFFFGSNATIRNNLISGGCGIDTSTGVEVDSGASAVIDGNDILGGIGNTAIGIHYNGSTGNITSNRVLGSPDFFPPPATSLGIGILVENGIVANQPVIGSIGAGNDIRGSTATVADSIGIWCINADPDISNNDLITGITGNIATNQAIGIFLDDCDNVTVRNNTRIEGGSTSDTVGWSVGIRADFSTGVSISNNPMITGGGSLVSTGILLFGSNATISGNTVNAGASTSINEGIVFSRSGGTVRNNTIDANGAGGLDAYGVRTFGCSDPALGPNGGNTFQGASGNGRHLSDENIPLPATGCPPAITINAAGNTWSEAPAPAGLQCGPGNDSFPPTRNYRVLNGGNCIQF